MIWWLIIYTNKEPKSNERNKRKDIVDISLECYNFIGNTLLLNNLLTIYILIYTFNVNDRKYSTLLYSRDYPKP